MNKQTLVRTGYPTNVLLSGLCFLLTETGVAIREQWKGMGRRKVELESLDMYDVLTILA